MHLFFVWHDEITVNVNFSLYCYLKLCKSIKMIKIYILYLFVSGNLKNLYITDISWYRDMIYLVTNASTVMWYNCTSTERGLLPALDNVASLAVDWVGHKIYWSNPKQQLVSTCRQHIDTTAIIPTSKSC